MWFGTYGGGISVFDGARFVNYSTAQGLVNNEVVSIMRDKTGNLWFCTQEGLSMMPVQRVESAMNTSDNPADSPLFISYTTSDGLPDNLVSQLVEAEGGIVFAGTNVGICELLPAASGKYQAGTIYNSHNGYPVKDVNLGHNAMYKDANGIIWIATGSDKTGLVRFDRTSVKKNTNVPVVLVQHVKINNENISWTTLVPHEQHGDSLSTAPHVTDEVKLFERQLTNEERKAMRKKYGSIQFDNVSLWQTLPQNLVLPHEQNNITFDYVAVETGRNFLVRYQYILEGYDREWSVITTATTATFGNMYEGVYTFKLKARSPEGIWSEPVSYTFTVLPPWWRTWWMYAVYGILFAGLIFGIVWWNGRRLRARAQELEIEVDKATVVIRKQKEQVEEEKKKSDELLLNILPEEVAEELKVKGAAEAKMINDATVLFTDFKDFTQIAEKFTPQKLVSEIHQCFSAFDRIMQKYGVEKIKTIGDSYMAAGGIPTPNSTHAIDVVRAALEIQAFMKDHKEKKEALGELFFEIRIGIHTGPVVAGIVGVKKYSYDIWGDTVNTASRMETSGERGCVNISGATYELVKNTFTCTYRGKIDAKNKGMIDMYFVEG
jgi:class 3 adenylate cyclase